MVEVASCCIQGISSYYAQNKGIMATLARSGYLEISLTDESGCDVLGIVVRDETEAIAVI